MFKAYYIAIGIGLIACSSTPTPTTPRTLATVSTVTPIAPEPLALPPGFGGRRSTILIGELHGTREIPAFVGRLVSTLSAQQPVVLALEIPRDVAPVLNTFLASDGGRAARDAFTRTPWWQQPYQDGRRSTAMLELIDTARRLKAGGAKVTVECFDVFEHDSLQSRDEAMAQTLMTLRSAHPDAAFVVYAGNVHVRKAAMARLPDYETMAMRMLRNGAAAIALNARYGEGSAWICTGGAPTDCGPQFMAGRSDERGIHLEASTDGAYDGWFGVGAITASPPAGFPELAAKLEAQLAALPSSASARRARALRAYNSKQYVQCAEEFGSIAPPTANDAYSQACCLALAGNKDAAFERLRFAIELGFKNVTGAENDPDLSSLRGDARWPFAAKP